MAAEGGTFLRNLLSSSIRLGSDEDTSLYCCPCELKGNTVTPSGYCKNCRIHLCTKCITDHSSDVFTRSHVVKRSNKLEKCSVHENEEVKFFCRAHDTLGCVVCMTLSHKLCDTAYIPDVSEAFVTTDEYVCFEKNLNTIIGRCKAGLSKIKTKVSEVEDAYEKTISAIISTRKKITEELDKMENELKEKANEYRKRNMDSMQSLKTEYDTLLKDILDIQASTNKKNLDKLYNQLFYEVQNTALKVIEYQSKTYALSTNLLVQECEFQNSNDLDTVLTTEKIFGQVQIHDKDLGPCNFDETVDHTYPVSHINIRAKGDKNKCYATGLAFLSCNQLAIADKANKNVKIVDVTCNKMISEIELSSSPRDITVIPPDQLAVTLRDEKKIQFLSTTSGLTKTEQIKTDGKCRGIHHQNGILYVTFDNLMSKIQLMDMKGNVIGLFETDQMGKLYMGEPKCIGLSPDQKCLYFTDHTKLKVFRISENNKVTSTSGKYFFLGLAVSSGGSVYACAKLENSVFQFSDDISQEQVFLNEFYGIQGPIAIVLSERRDLLYVSCGKGDATCCDNLHVYKIDKLSLRENIDIFLGQCKSVFSKLHHYGKGNDS